MSNSERRKGAVWEQELVKLFRRSGWMDAERAGSGHDQRHGDLLGVPGWFLEAKSHTRLELGTWATLAADQCGHRLRWALLVKRARYPDPEHGYAVMPIAAFIHLLQEAGY